jgi:hypothetical protein
VKKKNIRDAMNPYAQALGAGFLFLNLDYNPNKTLLN